MTTNGQLLSEIEPTVSIGAWIVVFNSVQRSEKYIRIVTLRKVMFSTLELSKRLLENNQTIQNVDVQRTIVFRAKMRK